jgi:opacity protein-like surface antigen
VFINNNAKMTKETIMNFQAKKAIIGLAILFTLPSAFAENIYVSGQVGVSQQTNDAKPYGKNIAVDADFPGTFDSGDGNVGSIGLGYIINENFRIETQLSYHDADFNSRNLGTGARNGEEYILNGELKSKTLTVEGFYDFASDSAFTPYVKVGVGVSDNSYSARLGGQGVAAFDQFDGAVDGYYDAYADGDSTEFTWNVGAGASYELTDSASVYAEYQYVAFGDVITGQDSFTDGFKIDDASAHEFSIGLRVNF